MAGKILKADPTQEYWFQEGCYITEIANQSTDPLVSIARARVPPGGRTRWHSLRDTWERYLIVSGNGLVEIGDLPAAPVSSGDVVLIPPETKQRILNVGDGDLVFYAICSPRFAPSNYQELD